MKGETRGKASKGAVAGPTKASSFVGVHCSKRSTASCAHTCSGGKQQHSGELTVYKGGQRIGVAVPSGSLTGPQYWAADVYCSRNTSTTYSAVTITRKPPP